MKQSILMLKKMGLRLWLVLLCVNLSLPIRAEGLMDVGPPVYIRVPAHVKNVVVGDFDESGIQGFATISWEDGGRHAGGRWEVAVYVPDHDVLDKEPPGTVAIKRATSFLGCCYWYESVPPGPYEADIAVADLDGERGDDLIVLDDGLVHIFFNPGDGKFSDKADGVLSTGTTARAVKIVTGNFDDNNFKDIAVLTVKDDHVEWYIFYFREFVSSSSTLYKSPVGSKSTVTGLLDYRWNSPYYTVGVSGSDQNKGNVFQLAAFPDEGRNNDSLWFRQNGYWILGTDKLTGKDLYPSRLDKSLDKFLNGPFAVCNLDGLSDKRPDLVLGAGMQIVFDVGTSSERNVFDTTSPLPAYGAVIADDFNQDGFTDLARVHGGDVDAKRPNTDLTIAFGDGKRANPFNTGGRKLISGLKILPPWWENNQILISGKFTRGKDVKSGKPFSSLLALGADVVTIYPNVGNGLAQLKTPVLNDPRGSSFKPGDLVRLYGLFFPGEDSQITKVYLKPYMGSTEIGIPDFKVTNGVGGDVLDFKMPSLTPGLYLLSVQNATRVSNDLIVTVL